MRRLGVDAVALLVRRFEQLTHGAWETGIGHDGITGLDDEPSADDPRGLSGAEQRERRPAA